MLHLVFSLIFFGSSMAEWVIEGTTWACQKPWDNTVFCASNGHEYRDPWKFICDQRLRRQNNLDLYLIKYGRCNAECPAGPKVYDPVCGSDNVTYYNTHEVICMQSIKPELMIIEENSCGWAQPVETPKKEDCSKFSRDNAPICASDGLTYRSLADLDCQGKNTSGLFWVHDGPCIDMKVKEYDCTKFAEDKEPVCGSNGETYHSKAELECNQKIITGLSFTHNGPCNALQDEEENCEKFAEDKEQVCGTDGQTYHSMRDLECHKKKIPDLAWIQNGTCNEISEKNGKPPRGSDCEVCSEVKEPVCGSDGITYNNMCFLKCSQTIFPDLHMAYEGACDLERCSCSGDVKPICATNGHTYRNKCQFDCNWSRGLFIVHHGECKEGDCLCPMTDNENPVCGSDGITYLSICKFHCQLNKDPSLTVVNQGFCQVTDGNILIRANNLPTKVPSTKKTVTKVNS